MTPEQCTLLGALLLEARNWLEQEDGETFDRCTLDDAVTVVAAIRRRLVREGAR